jgi:hypothetical protein
MEFYATHDAIRTVMPLRAGMRVTAMRLTTADTIERAVLGVCAVGGWFESVVADVAGGVSTERIVVVDGEPYAREVRVYTRGAGNVRVEVDTQPDFGGVFDPGEVRERAERRRGLYPSIVWADGDGAVGPDGPVGPWFAVAADTVPLGALGAFVAIADAATGARLLLSPHSSRPCAAVGTALKLDEEATLVLSVATTAGVAVAGSSVLVDVRASALQIRAVRVAPTVTAPSVVAWVPGLTPICFTISGVRTGTLVVRVDDEPEVWFPVAPTVEAMIQAEGHALVRATIRSTAASCVVRLAAPPIGARLVFAWMLASSARFAVTPTGLAARVRRVAVELIDAGGARAVAVAADAVWLDERGEPVSPAARVDVEDGLLVLERDSASAVGCVLVREGALTEQGGVSYEPIRAINGTSMAATALCEPWHVGRDALVGVVSGVMLQCELRFRHRYCATVVVAPRTVSVSSKGVDLVSAADARGSRVCVSVVAPATATVAETAGLSVSASFDDGSATMDVAFTVYPSATAPFGPPFTGLGVVVTRPFPWPTEYACDSTGPDGFSIEHDGGGRLRVTPLACALGYIEEPAWLHDTLRGRSLCFDAARVPITASVVSATVDGRVVTVHGASGAAAVGSVALVLVDGASVAFALTDGVVVLASEPGDRSIELRFVLCARVAAPVIIVSQQGARVLLSANGSWRPGGSYELTAVDSHGQACSVPYTEAPMLEASVDGSAWVPVAARFTVSATGLTVAPETWGAFAERRVALSPSRTIRVVVTSSALVSGGDASHADFTFGAGSLVSSSPTISHGANDVLTTGTITAARCSAGAFFATSDARLKANVETIGGALEKCTRLRGVTFEYAADRGVVHVGLIAQEVAAVFPSLVTEIDGYQRVDYSKLVGVLIEAVKELGARR